MATPTASFTDIILATASFNLSIEIVWFFNAYLYPLITRVIKLIPFDPGIINISIPAFANVDTESHDSFIILNFVGNCWLIIDSASL